MKRKTSVLISSFKEQFGEGSQLLLPEKPNDHMIIPVKELRDLRELANDEDMEPVSIPINVCLMLFTIFASVGGSAFFGSLDSKALIIAVILIAVGSTGTVLTICSMYAKRKRSKNKKDKIVSKIQELIESPRPFQAK